MSVWKDHDLRRLEAAPISAPQPIEAERRGAGRDMADSTFTRFIGGSPVAVFVRLAFVSLVVGALLVWLDIRPFDILRGVERFIARLWDLGFDAVREIASYMAMGAVVVVPIWLLMRIFGGRSAR